MRGLELLSRKASLWWQSCNRLWLRILLVHCLRICSSAGSTYALRRRHPPPVRVQGARAARREAARLVVRVVVVLHLAAAAKRRSAIHARASRRTDQPTHDC